MTRLGVRAFKTIAQLFELSDEDTLQELDLRIATPVYDLTPTMVASLGRASRFIVTTAATAAGNPNQINANPKNASHWDTIFTTEGNGLAVPTTHVMLVTGASVFLGTGANFTNAALVQMLAGVADLNVVRWVGQIDGRATATGTGGHYGHVAPYPRAFELRPATFSTRFQSNVTGNTDVTLVLDILSGPRGLFASPQ